MSETSAALPRTRSADGLDGGSTTSDSILQAALDAFYENGYHGSTVRDIARRVGVTVPALYYHHENKEAMLFALLDGSISRLLRLCRQAAEAEAEPERRFAALVEVLVRYTAVSRRLSYLDTEIKSLTEEHRRVYTGQRSAIEQLLADAVDEGQRAGVFHVRYPRDTVRALVGMIQAVSTWYRRDGSLTVDEVVDRYRDIAANLVGVHR